MAKLWHFDMSKFRNLFIGSVHSVVTFSCDEPINEVHHMKKVVLNFDCTHNFDLTLSSTFQNNILLHKCTKSCSCNTASTIALFSFLPVSIKYVSYDTKKLEDLPSFKPFH